MAKVELEESEVAALRRIEGVAQSMLSNPKTRTQFLKLQKEINPQAVIPELDAADTVMAAVTEVKTQVGDVLKRLEDREAKSEETRRNSELAARVTAGQDYLIKAGYNAEGIKKIEDLMLGENIGSYAAGLALFERLNPPASPSDASRTSRFGASFDEGFSTADDYKSLWGSQGQDDSWLNDAINNVRKDFRN